MNRRLTFDIIIPTYNRARTIKRSIESVLSQSYDNFKLIVINDGSTDETEQILIEYAKRDKRIHILEQHNQGVAQARNNALLQCTGDIISFLDSDDAWSSNKLKSALDAFSNDNVDMQHTNSLRLYKDSNEVVHRKSSHLYTTKDYLLSGFSMLIQTTSFRRELLSKLDSYFPKQKSCSDFSLLWRLIASANMIQYDSECLTTIHVEYDSLCRSSKYRLHRQDDILSILTALAHTKENDMRDHTETLNKFMATHIYWSLKKMISSGDTAEAAKWMTFTIKRSNFSTAKHMVLLASHTLFNRLPRASAHK